MSNRMPYIKACQFVLCIRIYIIMTDLACHFANIQTFRSFVRNFRSYMTGLLKRIRSSEFLKNVFTLVSATSLAQGIALLIYPVLSRIYTPAEHGLFALYMSIISITAIFSTGKYELAVMIPKKDRDGAGLVVLGILLSFIFSTVLLVFILVFRNEIPGWLGNKNIGQWLYFVPLSTFMVAVFQCFSYWTNRRKEYRNIAGANLGQSILNSAVKLSTSKALPGGGGLITGAIAGQITGALIFLGSIIKTGSASILKSVNRKELTSVAKQYSLFPRYNMVHYLTNNFSSSLPVFIFSSWFTAEQVGFYSFGFMMINRPMNLLTASFTQVFSQRVIEKYNHGEWIRRDVRQLITRLLILAVIPFTLAGIFGPAIFRFVFGDNWSEAGVYMRILLPWLFLVFLSSPLSFLPDMLSRQKKAMWIDIVKFVLRIIALAIGVILNDIYISLMLFSGISTIMVSYSLYWYVNLSRFADSNNRHSGK